MSADSLIISLPERQSVAQRSLYASLTAVAWFGWVFLWLPLITAVAWLFGVDLAYSRVVLENTAHGAEDLLFLLRAGAGCAGAFLCWSAYNRWRFRGQQRRRSVVAVPPEAIAHYFGADDIVSRRLRTMRRSVLHVDANGRPLRAVVDPPLRVRAVALENGGDEEHGYDLRPSHSGHPEELVPLE